MWGIEWLEDAYKRIMEDRYFDYQVQVALLPLARTPQSKQDASSMKKYQRDVGKMLDSMVPWLKHSKARRGAYAGKVKPGETVVVLGGGETAKLPLYKDAKVVKE